MNIIFYVPYLYITICMHNVWASSSSSSWKLFMCEHLPRSIHNSYVKGIFFFVWMYLKKKPSDGADFFSTFFIYKFIYSIYDSYISLLSLTLFSTYRVIVDDVRSVCVRLNFDKQEQLAVFSVTYHLDHQIYTYNIHVQYIHIYKYIYVGTNTKCYNTYGFLESIELNARVCGCQQECPLY